MSKKTCTDELSFDEMIMNAGLNRSQRKFCKLPAKKNIRLLAPAGSGKTFSLLWRCKYITEDAKEKGESVPHFLILAFTRSAKLELEKRLKDTPEFKGIKATIRTLNSWGWEQIKKSGKEIAVTDYQKAQLVKHDLKSLLQKYPIFDKAVKGRGNARAVSLIELTDLLKSLGFTHKMTKTDINRQTKLLKELGLFPMLQAGYQQLYSLCGIQCDTREVRETVVAEFFDFWKKAVKTLEAVNRYTYEDQKYWARMYLEERLNEGRAPSGASRYTHIMVDEFQDINPLDMALIENAALYNGVKGRPVPLTLLGDDDQAIFGWRGSSPKYILHPDQYFGVPFATCVLDVNYRSPKTIVEISQQLLSYNRDREPKEMKSGAKGRALIKVLEAKDVGAATDLTLKTLKNLLSDGRYKTIALIGRKQTTLFPYQVLLGTERIEYFVDYDLDIFEGEAMQSFQQILTIVYRAKDNDVDDPIGDILTILDKIDRYTLNKIDKAGVSSFLVKKHPRDFEEALKMLSSYAKNIKNGISANEACKIIRSMVDAKTVYVFLDIVINDLEGLDKDYSKKDLDKHYKEPQFLRLKAVSRTYKDDFRGFYRDLIQAGKMADHSKKKKSEDSIKAFNEIGKVAVHLVTATRAKGHEYDAVIVLDADDEVWPNRISGDIEEERRLFYVALSRAKKSLFFVTSADVWTSRFLLETRLV